MDAKAISLIEARLKYNWIAWFFGILMLAVHFLFNGEAERIVFFGLALMMIEIAGPTSYRKALKGEEGYHFMVRQTIDNKSEFIQILSCIILEIFILFVLFFNILIGLNYFSFK
jgi:hypothetical protein